MLSSPPAAATAAPEPPLRVLVGAILRRHRAHQGRTLRDVAEAARVSVPYLSEVERGRKEASSEVLAAVCRALGLGLVDLVGDAHAHLVHASTGGNRLDRAGTRLDHAGPARAAGRVVVDLTAEPGPALAPVVGLRREHRAGASVRLAA